MNFVYIKYSASLNFYHICQSKNLEDRLFRNNNLGSKSTKKSNDWVLKYTESFKVRSEALQRETEIKKKKSRKLY